MLLKSAAQFSSYWQVIDNGGIKLGHIRIDISIISINVYIMVLTCKFDGEFSKTSLQQNDSMQLLAKCFVKNKSKG